MIKLSNKELSEICNHLGKSKIISIQKILGGCINHSWRIDFGDSKIFLKKKILGTQKFFLRKMIEIKNFLNLNNIA